MILTTPVRKPFHYKATISHRGTNETKEVDVYSYWAPDFYEDTLLQIALCAAAEHNVFVDRNRGPNGECPWMGISATPVKDKKSSTGLRAVK